MGVAASDCPRRLSSDTTATLTIVRCRCYLDDPIRAVPTSASVTSAVVLEAGIRVGALATLFGAVAAKALLDGGTLPSDSQAAVGPKSQGAPAAACSARDFANESCGGETVGSALDSSAALTMVQDVIHTAASFASSAMASRAVVDESLAGCWVHSTKTRH